MRGYTLILSVVFSLILAISRVEVEGGALGSGCKGGYCWAYCSPFDDLWDWCYTKGGNKMDSKGYARCTGDADKLLGIPQCNNQWKCNGPCSL